MKFLQRTACQFILLIVLFLSSSNMVSAQLSQPFQQQSPASTYSDTPVDPCTDPFLYCPIDSGLYVLLAIGIGYGIMKVKRVKKAVG